MRIERTDVFAKWLDALRDLQARARIQARIARLAEGNPGQSRQLGAGVSELKVDVGRATASITRSAAACW